MLTLEKAVNLNGLKDKKRQMNSIEAWYTYETPGNRLTSLLTSPPRQLEKVWKKNGS
jgi:hypothetical protein